MLYMTTHHTTTITVDPFKAMKAAAWAEKVANERDRRRPNRAQSMPNKRAKANKRAARGKGWAD